ncbi:MAG TPA: glutamine amidotransferase [Noviherbaspirillum sp.]|nr:glutamine amidotransferase [Noviherbaspirillum sp.]
MKPLLIIKVGDALPVARERGHDFEHWIAAGFRIAASKVRIVDARRACDLPDPGLLAGAAVTGSAAMVTDREPWSESLVPWLRHAVEARLPILGICYGHQLLAHALGGEVAYHPRGMEIGTVQIRKTAAAVDDPLFASLPRIFPAQAVHSQTVLGLPAGAVRLAENEHDAHHAFRFGACAWGVQFHPEFDAEAMHGYIDKFATDLAARGRSPEDLRAQVGMTAQAASILQRFARLALDA